MSEGLLGPTTAGSTREPDLLLAGSRMPILGAVMSTATAVLVGRRRTREVSP